MALKNVVGLFDSANDATGALKDLKDAGFSGSDISFVGNNSRGDYGNYDDNVDTGTEAEEGAGYGATGGAVLGGLAGLLVGLGSLAIPGVGPVVAAGSLATTLGSTALGAGLGAAAGGLVGALVGAGVPEDHANTYAESVRRGGTLIAVQASSDAQADRAADIMERHNVVDIDRRVEEYRASGFEHFDDTAGEYDYGDDASRTSTLSNTDYSAGGDSDTNIGRDDFDRSSKVGTAGGTLAGAATGAAIGSAGGPVGTVVGGVVGAVTGGGVGAAGDAAGVEATDDDSDRGMNSTTNYASGTTGTTGYNTTNLQQGEDIAVPIIQEELRVGKREVDSGGVRVNTRVEEVPVNEEITVREESVNVDRRPVNREVTDADTANFQEGTFEVRAHNEEAVVDKQARVVEEVRVQKNVNERTENIQDSVRRTDVDVQELGGTHRATNEGLIEGTAGHINNSVERNTGLDTDRSGGVGDRDTRNNY